MRYFLAPLSVTYTWSISQSAFPPSNVAVVTLIVNKDSNCQGDEQGQGGGSVDCLP